MAFFPKLGISNWVKIGLHSSGSRAFSHRSGYKTEESVFSPERRNGTAFYRNTSGDNFRCYHSSTGVFVVLMQANKVNFLLFPQLSNMCHLNHFLGTNRNLWHWLETRSYPDTQTIWKLLNNEVLDTLTIVDHWQISLLLRFLRIFTHNSALGCSSIK